MNSKHEVPEDLKKRYEAFDIGETERGYIERIASLEAALKEKEQNVGGLLRAVQKRARECKSANIPEMQLPPETVLRLCSQLTEARSQIEAARADEAMQSGLLWNVYQEKADKKFTFSGWLVWLVRENERLEAQLASVGKGVTEWISIQDQPNPESVRILTAGPDKVLGWNVRIAFQTTSYEWCDDYGRVMQPRWEPTHWQPLPTPPGTQAKQG